MGLEKVPVDESQRAEEVPVISGPLEELHVSHQYLEDVV